MTDRLAQRVFAMLADGAVHPGESLAAQAGVTRSAVWKAIEALRADGLAIEAVSHTTSRRRRRVAADGDSAARSAAA
ncbi:MAG: HTH domain-containing protein, partial [Gammaproteobacteria bacterium]|nr:HTH domain-containing protein [Gammaproteobacteria bacterium]